MVNEDPVRPSRAGDQFHYYWAARRCLGLLPPNTDLVAISIEGPAVPDGAQSRKGIDSIDVAEYRGSTDPKSATHIRYIQLKHSSRRADKEWVASDLADTFRNFASRFSDYTATFGEEDVAKRFSFEFVTNRPVAPSLQEGVAQLVSGNIGARAKAAAKAFGLDIHVARRFAKLLTFTARTDDFLGQRSLLHDDVSGYLPEADRDAPLQMKDMVERRATTEFEKRPEINRLDVLKALGARLDDLYPAPPLIDLPTNIVPRKQLGPLASQVISGHCITIVRADAGVGKSVLSTQIGALLPHGSEAFIYDCFGNGAYRSASGYRHRCRDALVQLANEMAGRSLGDPLIPTGKADAAAYVRAFKARIERAASLLLSRSPDALLCMIIDAADNAQMAADELHDGPSFVKLIVREDWPLNVRLVLTARPHRVSYLDPPSSVPQLDLEDFDECETAQHLRTFFPAASDQHVREFHRQTSKNPRVQATALAQPGTLEDTLRRLAGQPRTVDALIGELLEAAVARVVSDTPATERVQIDQVCEALATLRPFVPLDIVARVANVSVAMVRSMAADLQRPLIVREDAIQFRDEPTESWFRERFRPDGERLNQFIARLLPAAAGSAYVAAGLPQLLLEAGRFDELVRLALSDEALPEEPAMARRDVALQRLQFALKAAIRDKRYLDAAKLALKAGGEAAADARQQKLISANTDLAAQFLEPEQMLEQVSRRLIVGGEWSGSDHAYEAAFLSSAPDLAGDAGSKLRLAYDWLWQWARDPHDGKRSKPSVKREDVAEMALAELNINGASACCKYLRRWRQREMSFKAGGILVSRLIDAGRFEDIAALAEAAGNDLGLLLAANSKLAEVGRYPPEPVVRRMTRLVTSRHVQIEGPSGSFGTDIVLLGAVRDAVVAALRYKAAPRAVLARTLTRYMPARAPILEGHSASYKNSRAIYLSAFCLRAALRSEQVTLERLKPIAMRQPKAKRSKSGKNRQRQRFSAGSGEIIRFEEEVGVLLPWHRLMADVQTGRVKPANIAAQLAATADASSKSMASIHDESRSTTNEVAILWGTIALGSADAPNLVKALDAWRQSLSRSLYVPTLLSLARHAGRTDGCERFCLDLGRAAFALMSEERDDAQGIADVFVDICRAVLLPSADEAREYFEQAIEVSGKIGEENLHRWRALSDLALAAGKDRNDQPELAYRFSRIAELVYAYTEYFDWDYTIRALVALSPPSGPTIMSRWIDRHFAPTYDAIPRLVVALAEFEAIDPRDALSLLPFSSLTSREDLLNAALGAADTPIERDRIAGHFLRYTRHLHVRPADWLRIAELLQAQGVDRRAADDLASAAKRDATDKTEAPPSPPAKSYPVPKPERDWNAVFRDLVLTDAGDVAEAHGRFRSGEPPWSTDMFFHEAMARVPAGKEASFISAVDTSEIANLFGMRDLLASLPKAWKESLAVGRAIKRLVKAVARRESNKISTDQRYPLLSDKELARYDLTLEDIFREAVTAMGDTSLPVGHGDLFDLAGLISTMISPAEAADALGYGLQLMEPLLLEGDDGPWRTELAPPKSVEEALAGFVWAALASPWAGRRWDAAHTVRSICALRRSPLVCAIRHLAESNGGGPFASPELVFYAKHAQLWLMIALARVAEEDAEICVEFLALVEKSASRQNPHVLHREFAAKALLTLHENGAVNLPAAHVAQLETINLSHLPRVPARRIASGFKNMWSENSGFLLKHDFGQYWAAPLGRRFNVGQQDIQKAAVEFIHTIWGSEETGRHEQDLRAVRRQFDKDRDYRITSSWPKVDDLSFYQSVHSIMMTAGTLLETTPLAGQEDDLDPFQEWLERYRLSLDTGLWLADRRDNKPVGLWLDLPDARSDTALDECAAKALTLPDGRVAASADWEAFRSSIRQDFSINSVLVSADRSEDLARALQNARDHDDYRLPTNEDDEAQLSGANWQLRSWLRADERDRRMDRHDPWSGGLFARIAAPGSEAIALLELEADRMERIWSCEGSPAFRSEIWSDGEEHEDVHHDRGKRLLASRAALDRLMEHTGTHMLFELRLRVERVETRHTRHMKKEKFHAVRLTRYFVLRPGTAFEPAPRASRDGRRARRRA